MPLIQDCAIDQSDDTASQTSDCSTSSEPIPIPGRSSPPSNPVKTVRRQSQHSVFARSVLMSKLPPLGTDGSLYANSERGIALGENHASVRDHPTEGPPASDVLKQAQGELKPRPRMNSTPSGHLGQPQTNRDGVGAALSDTPLPSAPNSPRITVKRTNSTASTPRIRPTTLDIPGLTKSKVSPDGRIAQRDVGSKLLICMVGLPARGKSYITKKLARYLNWLQHSTEIFNVGERRRIAAGSGGVHHPPHFNMQPAETLRRESVTSAGANGIINNISPLHGIQAAAKILVNGEVPIEPLSPLTLPAATQDMVNGISTLDAHHAHLEAQFGEIHRPSTPEELPDTEAMDQSASFFDPSNRKAALIREQVAMETLDEALEFLLVKNGSVSILDATNSTMERRKLLMKRIREKAGPELNVLFVESLCLDEHLLESNMRLKLSGPDYKDKDPIEALEDFKKRVAIYQKNYVPLGEYEEKNNMPYVQMIDVGRKVISHQIHGFLSSQVVYYLLNFNLAPRQIWITRHGESLDNLHGKIGGDSDLSENGRRYAQAMTKFIDSERRIWEMRQVDKANHTHFPPHPGDHTPPNPHYYCQDGEDVPTKNFCVWTSMLKRSIQSAEYFDDEDYEVKQMKMLDELYAGAMEGMTYDEIRNKHADEFELRKTDKLAYRYPGPGGEGYLDVVNRLRPVIIELERMTDHVLLITHRSVARILLAYFQGLRRDQVADLDCPLGMLYSLEPKPYGVEFRAYRYNSETAWFDNLPDFQLKREGH